MPIVCVDAVKENLPNVIEFVTKMLGENADGKLVFELELICEEVFVNICNYAYGKNVGKAEIDLTQTEYNIMALLSIHAGKVLTYAAIIRAVWGYSDYGSVKKLQVNMKNIRKKMGVTPGEKRYIINELGVGYRMLAEDEA